MNPHDLDHPLRMTYFGPFKSLAFYQNYLNMNVVFKELIEEVGFDCPLWLESDLCRLRDKLERYG